MDEPALQVLDFAYTGRSLEERAVICSGYLRRLKHELKLKQKDINQMFKLSPSFFHYIKAGRTSFGINTIIRIENLAKEHEFMSFIDYLRRYPELENSNV